MTDKLVPACAHETEIRVDNSRFIASVAPAGTPEEARAFIHRIRAAYPDASHHVPAFIIGHGPSVTEHCSDDGEPAGTAGRPVLAVLRGSGLGDAVVVVTRYFGGTKLGKGGLVRAYGDALRAALAELPLAAKVATQTVITELPYALLERTRLLAAEHHGEVLEESFGAEVVMEIRFPEHLAGEFIGALFSLSQGSVTAEIISSDPETRLPFP